MSSKEFDNSIKNIEICLQDLENKNLLVNCSRNLKRQIQSLIFRLVELKIKKGIECNQPLKIIFLNCQENYWFNRYIQYSEFFRYVKKHLKTNE